MKTWAQSAFLYKITLLSLDKNLNKTKKGEVHIFQKYLSHTSMSGS